MERWIVVWQERTRCAVFESEEEAVTGVKKLLISAVDIEDIDVFHSDRAIDIEIKFS